MEIPTRFTAPAPSVPVTRRAPVQKSPDVVFLLRIDVERCCIGPFEHLHFVSTFEVLPDYPSIPIKIEDDRRMVIAFNLNCPLGGLCRVGDPYFRRRVAFELIYVR